MGQRREETNIFLLYIYANMQSVKSKVAVSIQKRTHQECESVPTIKKMERVDQMAYNSCRLNSGENMFPQVKPLDHEIFSLRKAWSWKGFKDLIVLCIFKQVTSLVISAFLFTLHGRGRGEAAAGRRRCAQKEAGRSLSSLLPKTQDSRKKTLFVTMLRVIKYTAQQSIIEMFGQWIVS